jgi:hypothetical protein
MGPLQQQSITGRVEIFGGETFIDTGVQRFLIIKRVAGNFPQQAAAATGQLSSFIGTIVTLPGSVMPNVQQNVFVID